MLVETISDVFKLFTNILLFDRFFFYYYSLRLLRQYLQLIQHKSNKNNNNLTCSNHNFMKKKKHSLPGINLDFRTAELNEEDPVFCCSYGLKFNVIKTCQLFQSEVTICKVADFNYSLLSKSLSASSRPSEDFFRICDQFNSMKN